jgi:2-polyprenyl-6-methoxyphenol hydroxylase-like FAD-dependent oxidoreductase
MFRLGLIQPNLQQLIQKTPHLAIIGAGIGGVLSSCLFASGIPFTIYERDANFDTRSQGYGLTLQQASKAIED